MTLCTLSDSSVCPRTDVGNINSYTIKFNTQKMVHSILLQFSWTDMMLMCVL